MQLRHLRYFVKIVDAGSFSRAAATIHVAQPALSQQIAELEERLGVSLLLRSARGVRPTSAGEALYREAVSILRQVEQLPDIVRSTGAEAEGSVSLGMSSTLVAQFSGPLMEASRAALPKVMLKFVSGDSETLKQRVAACTLDLAVVFEDELTATFLREPVFRQRLYYIRRAGDQAALRDIAVSALAAEPLVLPGLPNVVRRLLDAVFAQAGVVPNIVVEADVFSSNLAAVGQGLGGVVLPRSDLSEFAGEALHCIPIVQPSLRLTASVIWSSDAPLTRPGEAVRALLAGFLRDAVAPDTAMGLEVLSA